MRHSDIHSRAISHEISQPSITNICWNITYLKFSLNHPEANELTLEVLKDFVKLLWAFWIVCSICRKELKALFSEWSSFTNVSLNFTGSCLAKLLPPLVSISITYATDTLVYIMQHKNNQTLPWWLNPLLRPCHACVSVSGNSLNQIYINGLMKRDVNQFLPQWSYSCTDIMTSHFFFMSSHYPDP